MRRAAANPRADKRVRQNLALSLALQGKFDEAEKIAAGDLPPDEARANVATLRDMIKQQEQRREQQAQTVVSQSKFEMFKAPLFRGAFLFDFHHADGGRAHDDDKEHRQEEQDHRHGELRRQCSRLLLGFGHALIANLLRQHA